MTEYAEVPDEVLAGLRAACAHLPEAYEEQAWTGRRWRVRKKTIAHVLTLDSEDGPTTIMTFRASPDEIDALLGSGHPFFKAGWGGDVVGMVLDGDVDWAEVAELLTESYCVLAPKKLVALVDRPQAPGGDDPSAEPQDP